MPEGFTQEQIAQLINLSGLNDHERLISTVTHYIQTDSIIQCHKCFLNENGDGIHTLTLRLQESSQLSFITDNKVEAIVADIQEKFSDIAGITIDDWQNKRIRDRIIDLHEYVKEKLKKHTDAKRVLWTDVAKIVEYAFGSAAVINTTLKRQLHDLGYLQCVTTQSLNQVMLAINDFYQCIKRKLTELLEGINKSILESLFNRFQKCEWHSIVSYVLSLSFWEHNYQFNLQSFNDDEKILLMNCLFKLNDAKKCNKNCFNVKDLNLKGFLAEHDIYLQGVAGSEENDREILNTKIINNLVEDSYILYSQSEGESKAYAVLRHLRNAIAHTRVTKSNCNNYFELEDNNCKTMQAKIKIDILENLIDEIIKTKQLII